jgi:dGTPase
LTNATLAAILKYPWMRDGNPQKPKKWGAYESERRDFEFAARLCPARNEPTVEAQLMDWADDVTYSAHDLEDFYRAGRLPLHLLAHRDPRERDSFFQNVFERRRNDKEFGSKQDLKEAFTDVLISTFSISRAYDGSAEHRAALRNFTANMIGRFINAASIESKNGNVRLTINPDLRSEVVMLKKLTWTYVIEASSLAVQQYGQNRIIQDLFKIYSESAASRSEWNVFPTYYRERLQEVEQQETEAIRTCVDLIASMTESQAIAIHRMLTGQAHASGLEEILR